MSSNPLSSDVVPSSGRRTRFSRVAAEVQQFMASRVSASDKDAEWQRVHSYIADVLKDAHVLYAKLARLEGDFAGEESSNLERISEAVLTIGEELSAFSKAFYEGKYDMQDRTFTYGDEGGGGGQGEEMLPSTPEFPGPAGEEKAGELEEGAGEEEEEAGEEEEEVGEKEEE